LLNKKIIKQEDIRHTRNLIQKELSERDFKKLKNIVVSLDESYLYALEQLIVNDEDNILEDKKRWKATKRLLIDEIYNRDINKIKARFDKLK